MEQKQWPAISATAIALALKELPGVNMSLLTTSGQKERNAHLAHDQLESITLAVSVAGPVCLSHGCNWSAASVQQAASHVAHLSLSQPVTPIPQECEVHPVGTTHRRIEGFGGLHTPLCLGQSCQESQEGKVKKIPDFGHTSWQDTAELRVLSLWE